MASNSITIGHIKLVVKYNREYDEWQVRVYVNGKFKDGPTYYGGSGKKGKQDAFDSMKMMAKQILDGKFGY